MPNLLDLILLYQNHTQCRGNYLAISNEMHMKESLSCICPFSHGVHCHKKPVTEITTSYYVLTITFSVSSTIFPSLAISSSLSTFYY